MSESAAFDDEREETEALAITTDSSGCFIFWVDGTPAARDLRNGYGLIGPFSSGCISQPLLLERREVCAVRALFDWIHIPV